MSSNTCNFYQEVMLPYLQSQKIGFNHHSISIRYSNGKQNVDFFCYNNYIDSNRSDFIKHELTQKLIAWQQDKINIVYKSIHDTLVSVSNVKTFILNDYDENILHLPQNWYEGIGCRKRFNKFDIIVNRNPEIIFRQRFKFQLPNEMEYFEGKQELNFPIKL